MSLKENSTAVKDKNKIIIFSVLVVVLLAAFGYLQFKQNFGAKNADKITEKALPEAIIPVNDYADASNVDGEVRRINVSDVIGKDEIATIRSVEQISTNDHLRGDMKAPVQIIVYGDFDCPSTASFNAILTQAKKEFGDKIAIAFRHYPLIEVHQTAMMAANAAECAGDQGKFWEMSDIFFAATEKNQLFLEKFADTAKGLNMDVAKFNDCVDNRKYNDKILAQAKLAKEFGVIGTPTTFVNGQIVNGATPMDDGKHGDGSFMEGLRSIINKQLAGK